MTVVRHLRDAGVEVENLGADNAPRDAYIEVQVDDRRARFMTEERRRAPYPGELARLASRNETLREHGQPLLIAPFVSEDLGKRLIAAGWSWADAQGNFDLRAPGLRLRQRLASERSQTTHRSLPTGTGSWFVIRWLIRHGELSSLSNLALRAHVSQPRISQLMHRLEDLGLVSKPTPRRWEAHREDLLDRFLAEYPGPGGSTSYLYSLDEPIESCLRLAACKPRPSMAISADVASDLLAPWRRPTHAVIYTAAPVDLEHRLRAASAHGHADANIVHIVPDDRSVFLPDAESDTREAVVRDVGLPLADPVQVLWDLQTLGADDRAEASEKLRHWILSSRSAGSY